MKKEEFERVFEKQLHNEPCFNEKGDYIGWFSRSCAVVNFIFCKNENGDWCILSSVRGEGTPDKELIGSWNCPCGYLDWNETLAEAAIRELKEETGVKLSTSDIKLVHVNSNPKDDKRQNITFRFVGILNDYKTTDFTFSHKGNEENEVGEIQFIPLKDVDKHKWAFNHLILIKKYAKKYHLK